MTRFLACLLTLLFSLSGPAMEGNAVIWQSTLAAEGAKGLGNRFKGKTAAEIDEMFKAKGFEPRGPDPLNPPQGLRFEQLSEGGHLHRVHFPVTRPAQGDMDDSLHQPQRQVLGLGGI